MALPPLTPEQRQAALRRAAQARAVRAELRDRLRRGEADLAEVLDRGGREDAIGRMKVCAVLESLPGLGPVRAGRLMERAGIKPDRRVRGLGAKQRAALVEESRALAR